MHSHHSRQLMKSKHYGIANNNSTNDAVKKVPDTIRLHKQEDKINCITSLHTDRYCAHNNIWWPTVLAESEKRNCLANIFNLKNSFLSER